MKKKQPRQRPPKKPRTAQRQGEAGTNFPNRRRQSLLQHVGLPEPERPIERGNGIFMGVVDSNVRFASGARVPSGDVVLENSSVRIEKGAIVDGVHIEQEVHIASRDHMGVGSHVVSTGARTSLSTWGSPPREHEENDFYGNALARYLEKESGVQFEVVPEKPEEKGRGVGGDPSVDVLLRAVPANRAADIRLQMTQAFAELPAMLGRFGGADRLPLTLAMLQESIAAKRNVAGREHMHLVLTSPAAIAEFAKQLAAPVNTMGWGRVWLCGPDFVFELRSEDEIAKSLLPR